MGFPLSSDPGELSKTEGEGGHGTKSPRLGRNTKILSGTNGPRDFGVTMALERPECHSPGLCIIRSRTGPAAVLHRRGEEHRSGQGSNTPLPKGAGGGSWTDLKDRDGPFPPGIPKGTSVIILSHPKAFAFFTLLQGSGLSGIDGDKN